MPKYLLQAPEHISGLQRKGLYPLPSEPRHHDYVLACFYLQNILDDYIAKKTQEGVEGWSKAAQEFNQQLDTLSQNKEHSLRKLKKCCEQFCNSLRFGLAEKAHNWAGKRAGTVLTQASQRAFGCSGQSVELRTQVEGLVARIQPKHPIYVIPRILLDYKSKQNIKCDVDSILKDYTTQQHQALVKSPLTFADLETMEILHEVVHTDKSSFLDACNESEKKFAHTLMNSYRFAYPHANIAPTAQRCKSRQEDYAHYIEGCSAVVKNYINETPGRHIDAANSFFTLNLHTDESEQNAPLRAFKRKLDEFIQSKQSGAAAKVASCVLPQWTGVTGGRLATALQSISKQIQPYKAEYIVHEYKAKTDRDRDWYAQHHAHPLKPLSLESLQVLHEIVWGTEERKTEFITELRNYDPGNIITTKIMKLIEETYPKDKLPTQSPMPSLETPAAAVPRRLN